jgi:hypothetical protein
MKQQRIALAATFLTGSGLAMWNYMFTKNTQSQKNNNALIKALLFHMRQSPIVKSHLGENVHRSDNISGSVHLIQGKAEMTFPVSGELGEAICHYKGSKINYWNQWKSDEFTLKISKKVNGDVKSGSVVVIDLNV